MLQRAGRPAALEYYAAEPIIEHHADPFPFNIEIENDPSYFMIKVESIGKLRTLVNRGTKNFGTGKKVVFFAQGRAISKAVSCAEIIKTYYKKPIYQITKVTQLRTIETWYPILEGLDPIRVTRAVPAIYILISQEQLDQNENGYQVYNHRDPKKVLNLQILEDNTDQAIEQKENIPVPSPVNHINDRLEQTHINSTY